jgi:hypothetical protein
MDLLTAPFSAHFVETGNLERVFGGQDGTVVSQVDMEGNEWKDFSTGTGPVLGVWATDLGDMPGYIVAATPEGESSSTLEIWDPMGGGNWSRHRRTTVEGRVSMLAMDPTSNTTVVIAYQDGSVETRQLVVERYEVDDTPSDWWVPLVVIGSLIILALVVVSYVVVKRLGRKAEPGTEEDGG